MSSHLQKSNDHLLKEGEIYYVNPSKPKYIIINNIKYKAIFNELELGLDLTGDTIQIINIDGKPFANSLGRVTEITIGKELK